MSSFRNAFRKVGISFAFALMAITAAIAVSSSSAYATDPPTYTPSPIIFGASGAGQGTGMADLWGGATGSGGNLRTGVAGSTTGSVWGGSESQVQGRSNGCGFNCSDLEARVGAYGGSAQRGDMTAFGSAGGGGPAQVRIGTMTGVNGTSGAAIRFDFPARPR